MTGKEMMAEVKFFESYSRWIPTEGRYETWDESVARVMSMHRKFYSARMTPALESMISFAEQAYKEKLVLGSQRALQFGGDELLKHHAKMYNCVSSYADRPRFFGEILYLLLCGDGAGFSVQHHHVAKLPDIAAPTDEVVVFEAEDSIEGWSDCFDMLISSFFVGTEYSGKRVLCDLRKIRPKGAAISGGFKAPGPEPLRNALNKVEELLFRAASEGNRLRPIHVYDIVMHMADAVIAGGVRRSATICLFSPDDKEMLLAKTGNWFDENPQRGRSNNSAVLLRDSTTEAEFQRLMKSVREFGEPGFIWTDSTEYTYNPCVEIGKYPVDVTTGRTGWQGCNLCEINGAACHTPATFLAACKAAAILGTLQAGYTDFKYLDEVTRRIFENEALIGVSITGWVNSADRLFDPELLRTGAAEVLRTNEAVAAAIGINKAARTTCVKPSGNSSVLLGTASGIHGEHAPRYLRNVQLNKGTEVAAAVLAANPEMVEESVWSANKTDYVVSFPVHAVHGSLFKSDLLGIEQLKLVKLVQNSWVEAGTRPYDASDPRSKLRHNVSNTIVVDDWDQVTKYVYDNRADFAGISFLAHTGDLDYEQAPFTEILTAQELVTKYGAAAVFASALTAEAMTAFGSVWAAANAALYDAEIKPDHAGQQKLEWVRRFKQYASTFFSGNITKASYCLKHVHLLYRWEKICRTLKPIDWQNALQTPRAVDVDTLGAQACAGGACDIAI